MRWLFILFSALFLAFPASAQHWRDADLGEAIAEGVASRDFLWLRGANGVLVRVDRGTGERTRLAEDAIDILADGERLWALTGQRNGFTFSLKDIRQPDSPIVGVGVDGKPVALIARPGEVPGVLATQSYVWRDGGRWKRTSLPASLYEFAHVARASTGEIYVGYDRGEWGGGLRRIDPATGSISFVTEPGEDLCGGDLNPNCHPVVGVFEDPAAAECVVVGAGLAHMGSSFGEVYRVCGVRISSVYSTPTPPERDQWSMFPQPWPLFDLVEVDGGWIGLSRDRYFRSLDGRVEERPMPAFADWAGIRISEERDGVLFVVSACCWGSADHPTLYSALALPVGP